jgi:hypothetical protein
LAQATAGQGVVPLIPVAPPRTDAREARHA